MLRTFRTLLLLVLTVFGLLHPASAQQFPNRPIRFVVGFAAGGAIDVAARILGQAMAAKMDAAIMVENKVGAGGALAVSTVRNAAPDGYTALVHSGAVTIEQALSTKSDFDIRTDLQVVGIPADADLGFFIHPSLPVNSVQELIDYAKAHPGKLNYASGGIGTTVHMVFEELKASKGNLDIIHVPYQGTPAATKAAVTNEVQILMLDAVYLKPQVDSGALRLLATGGKERSPVYKSTPTIGESVNLPGYEANYWLGLFLPKGTDAAIVKRYRDALEASVVDPVVRERLLAIGLKATSNSANGAPARIASDLNRWTQIIEHARIPKR